MSSLVLPCRQEWQEIKVPAASVKRAPSLAADETTIVPHYWVSRQHGKDVGARVVSRQALAATSYGAAEFLYGGIREVYPAVSRVEFSLELQAKMGQSDDIEDSTYNRHQDLCQKLNMDATAASEAWKSYETIRQNYTLEVSIYSLV